MDHFATTIQYQNDHGFRKLQVLEDSTKELQANLESLGDGLKGELGHILRIQEKALQTIYAERVFKRLKFPDMFSRYEGIDDAKENTFSWLFNNEESIENAGAQTLVSGEPRPLKGDEFDMRTQMRNKFQQWFTSPDAVFHISGVPGAGKSTMMKLIYNHPTTKSELRKWAGTESHSQ